MKMTEPIQSLANFSEIYEIILTIIETRWNQIRWYTVDPRKSNWIRRRPDFELWKKIVSKQVDVTRPMTVVTQFITSDGTDSGDLAEVRRFYVQNGRKIENSKVEISIPVLFFPILFSRWCAEPVRVNVIFRQLGQVSAKGSHQSA